jgi:hypothetical protein
MAKLAYVKTETIGHTPKSMLAGKDHVLPEENFFYRFLDIKTRSEIGDLSGER